MTAISIREHGTLATGPIVTIDGQEYGITLADPFSEPEEQRLEWYFEQHLAFPFTHQVRAATAAILDATHKEVEAAFTQILADDTAPLV